MLQFISDADRFRVPERRDEGTNKERQSLSGAIFGYQIKRLDLRVRDAEWICTLTTSGSGGGIAEAGCIADMIKDV